MELSVRAPGRLSDYAGCAWSETLLVLLVGVLARCPLIGCVSPHLERKADGSAVDVLV